MTPGWNYYPHADQRDTATLPRVGSGPVEGEIPEIGLMDDLLVVSDTGYIPDDDVVGDLEASWEEPFTGEEVTYTVLADDLPTEPLHILPAQRVELDPDQTQVLALPKDDNYIITRNGVRQLGGPAGRGWNEVVIEEDGPYRVVEVGGLEMPLYFDTAIIADEKVIQETVASLKTVMQRQIVKNHKADFMAWLNGELAAQSVPNPVEVLARAQVAANYLEENDAKANKEKVSNYNNNDVYFGLGLYIKGHPEHNAVVNNEEELSSVRAETCRSLWAFPDIRAECYNLYLDSGGQVPDVAENTTHYANQLRTAYKEREKAREAAALQAAETTVLSLSKVRESPAIESDESEPIVKQPEAVTSTAPAEELGSSAVSAFNVQQMPGPEPGSTQVVFSVKGRPLDANFDTPDIKPEVTILPTDIEVPVEPERPALPDMSGFSEDTVRGMWRFLYPNVSNRDSRKTALETVRTEVAVALASAEQYAVWLDGGKVGTEPHATPEQKKYAGYIAQELRNGKVN